MCEAALITNTSITNKGQTHTELYINTHTPLPHPSCVRDMSEIQIKCVLDRMYELFRHTHTLKLISRVWMLNDSNGEGCLTRTEFMNALSSIPTGFSRAEIDHIYLYITRDGGNLSYLQLRDKCKNTQTDIHTHTHTHTFKYTRARR
eukprot:GHVR01040717.1.p1 GENE.GHVR01040717.1~~GHVR01040717.1.p1  ORF type:complete len:156 (-),score=60.91 GHVR01040717.1:245-685(-)